MPEPQKPAKSPAPSDPDARWASWALWTLIAAYAALYAFLSWRRYATFHAQIDLSYYLRLVWGVAHGRYDLPLVQCTNILGLHLEPVLLPLILLRRLGVPGAPLLLITQAAAVALLAWPAYRLGRRHLKAPGPALCGAAVALFYPTVSVATLHDFHPVTLALAPLLGVLDALDEGRVRRALGLGILALACREDIAVQLALLYFAYAIKLYVITGHGQSQFIKINKLLVLFSGFLFAYFLSYIVFVQPKFVPKFGSYGLHFAAMPGAASAQSGRDLLLAILQQPWLFLRLFLTTDRVLYVWQILWPLALLSLLAPRALVGALPVLAINFLSGFPNVRTIESHYTTALVPFVLGSALIGAGTLHTRLVTRWPQIPSRRTAWALALLIFVCTAMAHWLHGGSPLALRSTRFFASTFRDGPDATELRARIAAVPPSVSVAARPGPLAHLSERVRALSPPEYDDGQPVDVVLTPEAQPRQRRIGTQPVPAR